MKLNRRVISLLLVSILAATLLGCNKDKNVQAYDSEDYAITGNSSSGTAIELQGGIYRLAETNNGPYIMYADKSDLSNWVYLCNRPTCNHDVYDCNAFLGGAYTFYYYDDHIYYNDSDYIYSMDMDGSNHKRLRQIPNFNEYSNKLDLYWNNKYILSQVQYSEEDMGIVKKSVYEVSFENEEDDKLLYEDEVEGDNYPPVGLSYVQANYSGKFLMALNYPTESPEDGMFHEYDLTKGSLIPIEADKVYQSPAYFKDDKAYYYKWNEGFFVKDMNSETEEKILEPIAKDSFGYITKDYLIQGSGYTYDKEGNGWITIYNLEGEVLEKIELKTDEDSYYMGWFNFETSDRLFFSVVNLDDSEDVYYILKKDIGSGKGKKVFSYTNGSSRVYVDPEKQ